MPVTPNPHRYPAATSTPGWAVGSTSTMHTRWLQGSHLGCLALPLPPSYCANLSNTLLASTVGPLQPVLNTAAKHGRDLNHVHTHCSARAFAPYSSRSPSPPRPKPPSSVFPGCPPPPWPPPPQRGWAVPGTLSLLPTASRLFAHAPCGLGQSFSQRRSGPCAPLSAA